jgi:SAM-dependent methyltransferase/uncharacterized protein YbaR (Trm112 family)
MNIRALTHVACPACKGQLVLDGESSSISVLMVHHSDTDVLEGMLRCTSCRLAYPIMCGVAILCHPLEDYLLDHSAEVAIFASQWGASARTLRWLGSQQSFFMSGDYRTTSWDNVSSLNMYLGMHYLDPQQIPFGDDDMASLFRGLSSVSFYDALEVFIDQIYDLTSGVLVDIGCNVGGLLHRLRKKFDFLVGIDISFAAALYARSILLRSPHRLDRCRLRTAGSGVAELQIDVPIASNVEVVVGASDQLPIALGTMTAACAANILEIVHDPMGLLDEMDRVLCKGGTFIHTSPYYWRADRSPISKWLCSDTIDTEEYLLKWLSERGCSVRGVKEIPWLLRHYDRYFQYYLVQVIGGQKMRA